MMTIIQPALDGNQLIPNDAFCTHPDAVLEKLLIRVAKGEHMLDYQNHYSYLFSMFYQNIMQRMLDGIDCVIIWIDDIVIYSVDISKHAATVVKVLDTLTSSNVKVSLEKVHIGYKRLLVLGHVITPEGRSADPLKVQVAQSFRRPATGKQLENARIFRVYGRLHTALCNDSKTA